MNILERVDKKNKKETDIFSQKVWRDFNKEKNYKWKEKKYNFIARKNKKIIGYIEFKILGGAAYLSQLIVSKKIRGKGIGELLLKKFENFSKSKKCHILYLETSEKHKEALRFYKKHGYKIVAKLKDNKFHFDWYYLSKEIKS